MDVTAQTGTGNPVVIQDETAAPPLMDVVYVVRPGSENESLRYSLRSLVNLPHNRVWISGSLPSWCHGVNHISKQTDMELPAQEDSNLNLYVALTAPELSDNFILMNDDFFVMKPITSVPVMHQGSLDARIAAYKTDNRYHQAYSLITTRRELRRIGIAHGLDSYELHMPMVFNKQRLLEMFQRWHEPLFALRPRTMYGNLYNLQGVLTSDAKDSSNPGLFLSTGVDFDISIAGELARSKFRTCGPYDS